jgi:hypothetical protein
MEDNYEKPLKQAAIQKTQQSSTQPFHSEYERPIKHAEKQKKNQPYTPAFQEIIIQGDPRWEKENLSEKQLAEYEALREEAGKDKMSAQNTSFSNIYPGEDEYIYHANKHYGKEYTPTEERDNEMHRNKKKIIDTLKNAAKKSAEKFRSAMKRIGNKPATVDDVFERLPDNYKAGKSRKNKNKNKTHKNKRKTRKNKRKTGKNKRKTRI